MLKQVDSEGVLGIDDPNKQESITLKLVDWEIGDVIVCELTVPKSDS